MKLEDMIKIETPIESLQKEVARLQNLVEVFTEERKELSEIRNRLLHENGKLTEDNQLFKDVIKSQFVTIEQLRKCEHLRLCQ